MQLDDRIRLRHMIEAAEDAKLMLRVRCEALYRVSDGFPRLIPTSIAGRLPPGVDRITYELRLDAAADWIVATTPSAATKMLEGLSAQ